MKPWHYGIPAIVDDGSTAGRCRYASAPPTASPILLGTGDAVTVQSGEEGIRFLLVLGQPIEERVAWYGPIVMNMQVELDYALAELWEGSLSWMADWWPTYRDTGIGSYFLNHGLIN